MTPPAQESAGETVAACRDLDDSGKLEGVAQRLRAGPEADLKAFDLDDDGRLDAVEIAKLLRAR